MQPSPDLTTGETKPGTKTRYMTGLDGLRTVAVVAVILYHLQIPGAPGGLMGVGVFFVLSGYLITDLLWAEWDKHQAINLRQFWLRRARRLLPALGLVLVSVICWTVVRHPRQVVGLRDDVLAAVLYMSNWWYIFHHVSYFARFGPPSPLSHLWSLAVEEQFYLFWPLVLVFGLRRLASKRLLLLGAVLAMATASAVLMGVLYHPGADPSRVYYGTDTRAFQLLMGAALAVVWPSRKLHRITSKPIIRTLDVVGILGLSTILAMIIFTNQYETFIYRGGMVVLSLATVATLASLAHPTTLLGKIMSVRPLKWLGVRSYGIYLWHYPVIVLTSPSISTAGIPWLRDAIQVSASVVIAALSYQFLEQPIRHGALGSLWKQLRQGRTLSAGVWIMASTLGAGVVISVIGLSGWSSTTMSPALALSSKPHRRAHKAHHTKTPGTHPASAPSPQPKASKAPPPVTAIGDSVMLDAAPYLKSSVPGINVDAKVGRQESQAMNVVKELKAHHQIGSQVIIELGNNGPFTRNQLVSLLQALGPVKRIVLVNTRVPRPWQDVVNTTLSEVASSYPHTTLVNWYQASANQNSYFYQDGVHLNPTGSKAYARLLVAALLPLPTQS